MSIYFFFYVEVKSKFTVALREVLKYIIDTFFKTTQVLQITIQKCLYALVKYSKIQ